MSSARDRQRAAARARLEREMAARAEAARRRRLLRARIGAGVAGALLLGVIIWIIIAVAGGGEKQPIAAPTTSTTRTCDWIPQVDPTASPRPSLPPGMKEVGAPPATVPSVGYRMMTLDTSLGVIKIEMDLSRAPCTAASFAHLASVKFYDKTPCFRLVPGIYALQCGGENNQAGPSYRFADENLPKDNRPWYRDGDVAMANAGANTNGSQFFFIFGNIDVDGPLQPDYSIVGRVIQGMDIIKQVAAAGFQGSPDKGEGPPKKKLIINTVTVSQPTATPAPAPTAATTGSTPSPAASGAAPSPSATPSTGASP